MRVHTKSIISFAPYTYVPYTSTPHTHKKPQHPPTPLLKMGTVSRVRPPIVARLKGDELKEYQRLTHLREFKKEVDTHVKVLETFRSTPSPSAEHIAEKDRALDFFKSLPSVSPQTTPQELVDMGLVSRIPLGLEKAYSTPRYLIGRQVLVRAPIDTDFTPRTSFLRYKEGGPVSITYRATIEGAEGDHFLVHVDGCDTLLKIPQKDVADLNQPQTLHDTITHVQGITIDYNDPWLKARIYQGYTHLADLIHHLDFNDAFSVHKDGSVDVLSKGKVFETQKKAVELLHNMVHMAYGYGSGSAGELAIAGKGVCYQQSTVLLALLAPFARVLGIELQAIDGKNFRHGWKPGSPAYGGDHGWLVVSFRPGMQKRVSDRTWQDPAMPLDRAYSYYGDRYPLQLQTLGSSTQQEPFTPADVLISERFKTARMHRLYGDKGVHGRDHHQ
jgi:hypothetical protein